MNTAVEVPIIAPEPGHPDRDRLRRVGQKVRKRLAANGAVQRIAVERAELWAVANFLDAVECGRLIRLIDQIAQPSTLHFTDPDFRTSYSSNVDPNDPFIRGLEARLDKLLGIDPAFGETIQGQRYTAGQQYKPHADWFQTGSPDWTNEQGRGGQRSFTAMAYLNFVEEGGETDFPRLGIAVEPRPGTLLIWNNADAGGVPNPWTVHAGNPVARGVKYVITKWYRTWRWT
jgi:prolyl 4-hydroxylase